MEVQSRIDELLRSRLAPTALEVTNESSMHNVPPGAETHFKVLVVSDAFAGMSSIDRHRMVYDVLGAELRRGLHALSITSRTPEEWQLDDSVASTPPCRGGAKR